MVFSRREARITARNKEDPRRATMARGHQHMDEQTAGGGRANGYLSTEQEVICFNVTTRPINNIRQYAQTVPTYVDESRLFVGLDQLLARSNDVTR